MSFSPQVQAAFDAVEEARGTFQAARTALQDAHDQLAAYQDTHKAAVQAHQAAKTDLDTKKAAANKALADYWNAEPEAPPMTRAAKRKAAEAEG